MKVLAVASEIYPLVKTGGLADVVGALPGALAGEGIEVRTLVPGYPAVLAACRRGRVLHTLPLMGGVARVRAATVEGLAVLCLDAPHLYDRAGGIYGPPGSVDWPDNPERFGALGQAAAAIAGGALPGWRPDAVHAHDWQAGLTPAYLHYGRVGVPSLFTLHNLAFPGWAPADRLGALGLPGESFWLDGVEFYGGIGFLKAGLRFASRVSTVSPSYAAEILRPENGQGLDGLLRVRAADLVGIVNGIDTAVWNPATDGLLAARYAGPHARRRGRNKAAVQAGFGLEASPGVPLFGIVSRLTRQKGIDLVLEALPELLALGGQLAVLGTGEGDLEAGLRDAAAAHPERVGVRVGYDEGQAHVMQAGVDALLVPSRFEPCGLTQLYALRYGAVPVVARVGGLADTVIDANPAALSAGVATGVQFLPVDAGGLVQALRRTVALYGDPVVWGRVQARGMRADVGWGGAAATYAEIFRSLVETADGVTT